MKSSTNTFPHPVTVAKAALMTFISLALSFGCTPATDWLNTSNTLFLMHHEQHASFGVDSVIKANYLGVKGDHYRYTARDVRGRPLCFSLPMLDMDQAYITPDADSNCNVPNQVNQPATFYFYDKKPGCLHPWIKPGIYERLTVEEKNNSGCGGITKGNPCNCQEQVLEMQSDYPTRVYVGVDYVSELNTYHVATVSFSSKTGLSAGHLSEYLGLSAYDNFILKLRKMGRVITIPVDIPIAVISGPGYILFGRCSLWGCP